METPSARDLAAHIVALLRPLTDADRKRVMDRIRDAFPTRKKTRHRSGYARLIEALPTRQTWTVQDVIATCDDRPLSKNQANCALVWLHDTGRVERVGRGVYRPTGGDHART